MRVMIVAVLAAGLAPADLSWVEKRVEEWQPRASERKFDRVGWCTDILSAEALAKQSRRPIFLFTHDGRMSTGRC